MTPDEKNVRIAQIDCAQCGNYAWHLAHMEPVERAGHWHHPSCPVAAPQASFVGGVRRTDYGWLQRFVARARGPRAD